MCICWTCFHRLQSRSRNVLICLQPHPSDSKICPKWKIEKQIQEIKTNKNISYPEARKLIVPQLSQTYAQATKSLYFKSILPKQMKDITKIKCPPLKLLAHNYHPNKEHIFLLLLPHHPSAQTRNSYPPSLPKTSTNIGSSATNPTYQRQKGKFKKIHHHYIVPER
ncbi:uncharacterized protein TNCV_559911 [Trichonephila clavipes]|nr:uncharacterized protein TNCV_559911 [Trichonephila clavipes]